MAREKTFKWIEVAKKELQSNDVQGAFFALNHATQNLQDCDLCGDSFPVENVKICFAGQILCEKCRREK